MNLIKATACAASILALTPIFAQEYGADESKIATVVYVSSSAGGRLQRRLHEKSA